MVVGIVDVVTQQKPRDEESFLFLKNHSSHLVVFILDSLINFLDSSPAILLVPN